jgi:hypothetical protein
MVEKYLESAEQHIKDTEGLILRQLELIHRLGASGQDIRSAERFLKLLEQGLERFKAHRDLVRLQASDGPPAKRDPLTG